MGKKRLTGVKVGMSGTYMLTTLIFAYVSWYMHVYASISDSSSSVAIYIGMAVPYILPYVVKKFLSTPLVCSLSSNGMYL